MDPSVDELLNHVASYSLKWNVLNENLPMLLEKIVLIEVLPRVKSRGILRDPQLQLIEAETVPYNKIYKLIDSLQKCDDKHFLPFCEILCETGQVHLIEIMNRKNIACAASLSANDHIVHVEQRDVRSIVDSSLKQAADALKLFYKRKLRYVHPFSLPFKFDIETTWISLALQKKTNDRNTFIRMEDHLQLINEAFVFETKLLYIEGRAASGKTSLMRRIAYDWALGKLAQYDLILLIELRNLTANAYDSIHDLALSDIENGWECEANDLQSLLNYVKTIKKNSRHSWLILLDGYDEVKSSSPVCKELKTYLESSRTYSTLKYDIIISSRPGYLSSYKEHSHRVNFTKIIGFDTAELQSAYINAHFSKNNIESSMQMAAVEERLKSSAYFRKLAETPLFLTFICLVHEHLKVGSVFELYTCIIWWLIDRYQRDHEDENVPKLFGFFVPNDDHEKSLIIQNQFKSFPLLRKVGRMAFDLLSAAEVFFTLNTLQSRKIDTVAIKSGIILLDKHHEDAAVIERYLFPHRTIQEFLAGGLFYFWPTTPANQDLKLNPSAPNEIERFVWRSISAENLEIVQNPAMMQFFNFYSELTLDLVVMDQCNHCQNFVEVLNACWQKCTFVHTLTLFYASSLRTMERTIDFSAMKCLTSLTLDLNSCFDHIHSNSQLFVLHKQCRLKKLSLRHLTVPWTMFYKSMGKLAENDDLLLTLHDVKIKMMAITRYFRTESALTVVVYCKHESRIFEFMEYCPQMKRDDLLFLGKAQPSLTWQSLIPSRFMVASAIKIHPRNVVHFPWLSKKPHVLEEIRRLQLPNCESTTIECTGLSFDSDCDPESANMPVPVAPAICETCEKSLKNKVALFKRCYGTAFSDIFIFIVKIETNEPFRQSISVGDIVYTDLSLPLTLLIGKLSLVLHKN